MRVFKLISLCSLILVLGGQGMFLPGQAYAWSCCKTCPCRMGCTCPGVGTCPWFYCNTDDSSTLQTETVIGNERLDIRGMYDSQLPLDFRSQSIDRLIGLASSGQCAMNNLRLKYFQSAGDRLKFDSDLLKYNASSDNDIVALKILTN